MYGAPHIPWTAAQRSKICCYLRDHGLWEDRAAVCGIDHLSDLTIEQATALIKRFYGPGVAPASRRCSRLAPGTIRPATDAQRRKIHYLLRELGWSPDTCTHWLWARHLIGNVDTTPMSTATAHKCITELDNALGKPINRRDRGERRDGDTRNSFSAASACSAVNPSAEVPF